jgi:hypothetical protein
MRTVNPVVLATSATVVMALSSSGTIERDPAQARLAGALDALAHRLGEHRFRQQRFADKDLFDDRLGREPASSIAARNTPIPFRPNQATTANPSR